MEAEPVIAPCIRKSRERNANYSSVKNILDFEEEGAAGVMQKNDSRQKNREMKEFEEKDKNEMKCDES